mmetsp:Transcript_12546/g.28323  ORF Transcript_12546/g.28323 Transcript_12546/m.28323 type:complete len:146 (+) Transcript_12546:105-542(+)
MASSTNGARMMAYLMLLIPAVGLEVARMYPSIAADPLLPLVDVTEAYAEEGLLARGESQEIEENVAEVTSSSTYPFDPLLDADNLVNDNQGEPNYLEDYINNTLESHVPPGFDPVEGTPIAGYMPTAPDAEGGNATNATFLQTRP